LLVRLRWVVVPAYIVLCAVLLWVLGSRLGTELFPQVDSGEFVVRFRAPPGSNFEITRQIWAKSLQVIQEETGAENVDISMGFVGQVSPISLDPAVFARNVNLGDFVLPTSGDPSQGIFSQGVSPSRSTPLYVLNRIDPVLFVVGVPEADAAYVAPGTKARVRVPALAGREFAARVTRTSWALNSTSRTLMAQIDLPNPKAEFVPGMYAYGSVLIERTHVRALPVSAVTQIGNQTYCYLARDGKAVRTPIQTGVSDGSWVEATNKLVRSATSPEGVWEAFDGTETVINGDLSEISDGVSVKVDPGD
jgi:hypothetical protein